MMCFTDADVILSKGYLDFINYNIINKNHSSILGFTHQKSDNIKIGYRFVFQSNLKTLTDEEVDKVINAIVESTLAIDGIEIPGLKGSK